MSELPGTMQEVARRGRDMILLMLLLGLHDAPIYSCFFFVFCSYFSGLACVVVFLYAVR